MSLQMLRHPSLELSWLPNSALKGVSTPRVALIDSDLYGGVYYGRAERRSHPQIGGQLLDIDLSEGALIALCITQTAGTIAHEFRHHQQAERGLIPEHGPGWYMAPGETYRDAIVRYFRTQWWEMDALKFEHKHAPSDTSAEWLEWLTKH